MTKSDTARDFMMACDGGEGWDVCSRYCTPDATFSVQAGALAGVDTLAAYTEWAKGLLTPMPNATFEIKSLGYDEGRGNVAAYAVFTGTHTGEGGPVPPTGKTTSTDYVYVMDFDGDKISHITKIWNDGSALAELGWM